MFQIEGELETVLRPGDVFYEPEGARITRFDAQDAGVTFLAYFLLGPGQDAAGGLCAARGQATCAAAEYWQPLDDGRR